MNNYYPDGTGPNDPNAPWNEKEYPRFYRVIVGKCESCNEFDVPLNEDCVCEYCFDKEQENENES